MQLGKLLKELNHNYRGSDVTRRVQRFNDRTGLAATGADGASDCSHTETAKEYYDLCTGFMVWAWGESLHFAPLKPSESPEQSKARHQRLMISKLELQQGMAVIDVGCGVGGPMRRVVREAGVRVVGVNINEIQLERAKELNAGSKLAEVVRLFPKGSAEVVRFLDGTADAYVADGKTGIFTPLYCFLARKPH